MYVKSREQGKSGTFCHTAYVFRRIGCEESCESRIVQVILSGVCGVLYITSVEQKHAECGEDQVESELGMSGLDFFLTRIWAITLPIINLVIYICGERGRGPGGLEVSSPGGPFYTPRIS